MNFQEVSVGQKRPVGGYVDGAGTPSALLAGALEHVDTSLGRMVAGLKARGLYDSTLIIVTAKHGQSLIDRAKLAMEAGGRGNATVIDPLLWLQNQSASNVANVVGQLTNPANAAAIFANVLPISPSCSCYFGTAHGVRVLHEGGGEWARVWVGTTSG